MREVGLVETEEEEGVRGATAAGEAFLGLLLEEVATSAYDRRGQTGSRCPGINFGMRE